VDLMAALKASLGLFDRMPERVSSRSTCQASWSDDWRCNKPEGHEGQQHRDPKNGSWWFAPEAPARDGHS